MTRFDPSSEETTRGKCGDGCVVFVFVGGGVCVEGVCVEGVSVEGAVCVEGGLGI